MRNNSIIVKCRKSGGSAVLVTPPGCVGKVYKLKIWKNGTLVYTEVQE